MNERATALLHDMLDMARKAQEFLGGKSEEALDQDELLSFALVRALEVVGEAASRVAPEVRTEYPEIPWKVIIGMRNKIIHDYRTIDIRIVWKTVVEDLPPLIIELEKVLGSDKADEA